MDEEEGNESGLGQPGSLTSAAGQSAVGPVAATPTLHFFRPMVDWPMRYGGPPFAINFDAEFNIPTEEQRMNMPSAIEAAQRVSTRPRVVYPHPLGVPATPAEAPAEPAPPEQPRHIPLEPMPSQPPLQAGPTVQLAEAQQPQDTQVRQCCASAFKISEMLAHPHVHQIHKSFMCCSGTPCHKITVCRTVRNIA